MASASAKVLMGSMISVLVCVLLLGALLPELTTQISGAGNVTGVSATLLTYLPWLITAGMTIAIISAFFYMRGKRGGIYIIQIIMKLIHNKKGATVTGKMFFAVGLIISLICAVPILEEVAYQISDVTGAGGALEGTLSATFMGLWVLLIVAGIIISVFGYMMSKR